MNRWIKKGVAACLALGLGFASGSILASSGSGDAVMDKVHTQTHKTAKNLKKAKKAPSWLFVLQAKKGTITKTDKKGVYTLTFKHSDMGPAIAFTDRPDRIVKKITPEQLKKIWNQGPDSFEKDPPNAVFSARGMNAEIVAITSMTVDRTGVRLGFSVLQSGHPVRVPQGVGDFVLVVDDVKGDLLARTNLGAACSSTCKNLIVKESCGADLGGDASVCVVHSNTCYALWSGRVCR